eukprot:IDg8155t1
MLAHIARAPFLRRLRLEADSASNVSDPLAMRRRQSGSLSSTLPHTVRHTAITRSTPIAHPRSVLLSWLSLALSLLSAILLWGSTRTATPPTAGRPQLHLFAAPKPYVGVDAQHQLRALQSWLALRPRPHITLLGSGLSGVARRFGVLSRAVDTSFLGVPLFSAVVAAANSTQPRTGNALTDVVVLLNADIVLFDDFSTVVTKLRRVFGTSWLALGGRWDVDKLPRAPRFRASHTARLLATRVRDAGTLHTFGGVDVWAWPAGHLPSIQGGVPPFVLGRGRYDNWFTHELLQRGGDSIIDISEAATLTHVRHDHHLVTGSTSSHERADMPYWTADPAKRFELYVNAHLAATRGAFVAQQGTVLHAPLKLAPCYERRATRCLLRRRRPHACRCEHAPFVASAMSDPYVVIGSRVILCGLRSTDAVEGLTPRQIAARWPVSGHAGKHNAAFGLPLTRKDVLAVVRNRTADGVVMLVVASAGEETLVANTVCAARRVGHALPTPARATDAGQRAADARVRARIYAAHSIVVSGAAVAVIAAGAFLRRDVAAHLGRNVAHRADVAIGMHDVAPDANLLFARASPRAARLLELAFKSNSRTSPLLALEGAACGPGGLAAANGRFCESNDGTLQILGEHNSAPLLGVLANTALSDAYLLAPDERESAVDRMTHLRASERKSWGRIGNLWSAVKTSWDKNTQMYISTRLPIDHLTAVECALQAAARLLQEEYVASSSRAAALLRSVQLARVHSVCYRHRRALASARSPLLLPLPATPARRGRWLSAAGATAATAIAGCGLVYAEVGKAASGADNWGQLVGRLSASGWDVSHNKRITGGGAGARYELSLRAAAGADMHAVLVALLVAFADGAATARVSAADAPSSTALTVTAGEFTVEISVPRIPSFDARVTLAVDMHGAAEPVFSSVQVAALERAARAAATPVPHDSRRELAIYDEQGNHIACRNPHAIDVPIIDEHSEKQRRARSLLAELGVDVLDPAEISEDWDSVAGYDDVKRRIEDALVLPLQHPNVFDSVARGTRARFASNVPAAVLYSGPPGCGKTLCARVLAASVGVPFVHVPLEALLSKFYGETTRRLASVLDAANDLGRCIVF